MPELFRIRRATIADTEIIAGHRARMFEEMGDVPPGIFAEFRDKVRDYLRSGLTSGEYLGWLAIPADDPEKIIGGAGAQLRRVLPHPFTTPQGEITVAEGRHAIVLNVFTEPEWRRRGVAGQLMEQVIRWSQEAGIERLVLHASDDGRALYEKLGFVATNEMRLGEGGNSFTVLVTE